MSKFDYTKVGLAQDNPYLSKIIELTNSIPAPPKILAQIVELTSEPGTHISRLTELIEMEPAVVAEILRLSNSAKYGRSRTIYNIREAIITIGFHEIKRMATTLAALSLYKETKIPHAIRKELWHHSLSVAIIARMLATKLETCEPEHAYVTGLLHDLGKIVLMQRYPSDYINILQDKENDGQTLLYHEELLFGFSHPLLAAVLIGEWLLPEQIAIAVVAHHSDFSTSSLSGIITLANAFVTSLGYNFHFLSDEEKEKLTQFGLEKRSQLYHDLIHFLEEEIDIYH